MAYEKQNFEDGKILSASQLNHIEDGIEAIEGAVAASTPPPPPLIVNTFDDDDNPVTVTPSEIFAHVKNGGPVYFDDAGTYIHLSFCSESLAEFIDFTGGGLHRYIVDADGDWSIDTARFATKDEIGDISDALDSIIAIQNGLIGGDGA